MFSLPVRCILLTAALAYGAYSLATGGVGWLPACAAALLFAVGYFRNGTVWLAVRAMRGGDVGRARQLLDQNHFPTWLGSQARAYYEWLRGGLASDDRRWQDARAHFEASLALGLRTENDRSLVEGYLASALFNCGDVEGARKFLEAAKGRKHKPEVDAVLQQVEQAIGNAA